MGLCLPQAFGHKLAPAFKRKPLAFEDPLKHGRGIGAFDYALRGFVQVKHHFRDLGFGAARHTVIVARDDDLIGLLDDLPDALAFERLAS